MNTIILNNIVENDNNLFDMLCDEIKWHRSLYLNNLLLCNMMDNSIMQEKDYIPIYRTHNKHQLFPMKMTPIVKEIQLGLGKYTGHPLNFVQIQLNSYVNHKVSWHTDKTLDAADDSFFCEYLVFENTDNYRKISFRNKIKDKITNKYQKHHMNIGHNSCIVVDAETNRKYMHSISKVKNSSKESFHSCRNIMMTFRYVKTFYSIHDQKIINKYDNASNDIDLMHSLFNKENKDPHFDKDLYKHGFNCLGFDFY